MAATTIALARGATPSEALAWGAAAEVTAVACAGTTRLRRPDVAARYRQLTRAVR